MTVPDDCPRLGAAWEPAADGGAAAVSGEDPDAAAVGFDDLAAERKAQPAAALLGGVERLERAAADVFGHARAAIQHQELRAALGERRDAHRALVRRAPRFDG